MEKKNEIVLSLNYNEIPEFQDAEAKQKKLLTENKFIPVKDKPTYEDAKKARLALRQGRYELQNGEKAITAKINDFKKIIKAKTEELIGITLKAEEKQHAEILEYELKEAERIRKELEAKKKASEEKLKNLNLFREVSMRKIAESNMEELDAFKKRIQQEVYHDEHQEVYKTIVQTIYSEIDKRKEDIIKAEEVEAQRKVMEEELGALKAEKARMEKENEELRKEAEKKGEQVTNALGLTSEETKEVIHNFVESEEKGSAVTPKKNITMLEDDKIDLTHMLSNFNTAKLNVPVRTQEARDLLENFFNDLTDLFINYIDKVKNL